MIPDESEECPKCRAEAHIQKGGPTTYCGHHVDMPTSIEWIKCPKCGCEFFTTEQMVRFYDAIPDVLGKDRHRKILDEYISKRGWGFEE